MKTIICMLCGLMLIASLSKGQTMETTLKKLIENKLIDQNQVRTFEFYLLGTNSNANSAYLYTLLQIEYMKYSSDNKSLSKERTMFGSVMFVFDKPNPTEQIKINEELSTYLSKLQSCSLINQNQVEHFKLKIANNEFVHIIELLTCVFDHLTMKEYMSPDKLKAFAIKLKSQEIIGTQYNKLIEDIDNDKLTTPIDFLKYCNKAVIINEKEYSNEPSEYLESIHRKTAIIIPNLEIKNFEFKVVSDSSTNDKYNSFYYVFQLESNGKKYKQKSYRFSYDLSDTNQYREKIDEQSFYKIFNKILANISSPYRLHLVSMPGQRMIDNKVFGIIALTKEQADRFRGGSLHTKPNYNQITLESSNENILYFEPSHEVFDSELADNKIEKVIDEYIKIGLLSHLTSEQIMMYKEEVSEKDNRTFNEVLMSFPNVVYMFDGEFGNLDDPYTELIQAFKKISHDDFNANDIKDNFDISKKYVTVQFSIRSKKYSKKLKVQHDWIDTNFFDFVNTVVEKNKLKGQFYQLYTGGQEFSIIYLTKEQYDYVKTKKLLFFIDDFKWEDEYR